VVLGGCGGDGGIASSSCLCPGSPHLSSHPSLSPSIPSTSVPPPAPTIAVLLPGSHCTGHRSVAGFGGVGWMQAVGSCGYLALPSQPPPTTPRVQAAELPAQAASSWALVSPTANWLHSRVGNAGAGLGGSRPHANRIQNASTSNAELLAAPGLHVEWNSAASSTQHTRQAERSAR
jgi:hypothetical protein